jgi:hypothetical protein
MSIKWYPKAPKNWQVSRCFNKSSRCGPLVPNQSQDSTVAQVDSSHQVFIGPAVRIGTVKKFSPVIQDSFAEVNYGELGGHDIVIAEESDIEDR